MSEDNGIAYLGVKRQGKFDNLAEYVGESVAWSAGHVHKWNYQALMQADFLKDLVILASAASEAELALFIEKHQDHTL